tara:strand:+ start:138 stop:575 length:438 start_codon:yes stop_codon:yes gene_type:complete
MIIECPNCNKKFEIDQNLIPNNGRLLQCGSCSHKWFFELKINKDIKSPKNILPENTETIIQEAESSLEKKIDKDIPEKINKKKVRNNVNYLNVFFIMLLSTVALILILDTFEAQISLIFPDINLLLNNLYQSIIDIKLFTLDLIK